MKTAPRLLTAALLGLLALVPARAADVSGQWRGEIETPMGLLKCVYTFQADGEKLTGKVATDSGGEIRDTTLQDVRLAGNTLTFTELVAFDGNEMRIDYTGRLAENEIQFTRQVGDFATENFVATRVNDAAPLAAAASPTPPANPAAAGQRVRGPDGLERVITLGPDDHRAFPDAPAGFDVKRDAIPHGRLELVEYDSKSVGARRRMNVYTPPGYSAARKYPVLFLLHGIGGDETEWERWVTPDVILDNLLADGELVPMIAVMPNGRAMPNDRAGGDIFSMDSVKAFAAFDRDLLGDIIPAIEARYSVQADREHRALAGYSMGGGQTLNIGLAHLDTFAWIGAFSSAPNTKAPAKLVPDPAAARRKLKLLWLSCGNRDGLINISQGVHAYLKEKNVPHIWNVDSNGHDSTGWRNNLYLFSQRIFR